MARAGVLGAGLAGAALVAAAFPLWQTSQWSTASAYALEQPIPFSHAHHVQGLGIDCRYCHTSFDESSFAGMPPTETCMGCHLQLYTTAPLLEPVRQSWRTGQPVAWRRVFDLPDFVYFEHRAHVAARVSCLECHGPIESMPLTWQPRPVTMGWCLECHRDPGAAMARAAEAATVAPTLAAEPATPLHPDLDLLTDCTACHR